MEVFAKLVTEFFMIALCITSAPVDQQDIRIDLVGNNGYVDTLIVRREEVGFIVYDEMNGKLVEFMTIVPKEGVEHVYVCTDPDGSSETIDLPQGIKGLNVSELRATTHLRLNTTGGMNITVNRSGEVGFITSDRLKQTYVVH